MQPELESKDRSALIIDDDPLFQQVAELALQKCGFSSVCTANDGVEGIELLKAASRNIDLVLCDLEMPNMDGARVISELAGMGFPGKIIIVSGTDFVVWESVLRMGKLANANIVGALRKPFKIEKLRHLIDRPKRLPGNGAYLIERECLVDALETRKLKPFFQPKIDLSSFQVTGFEVLCRHVSDDGTISPPLPYIDSATCHSMIGSLTKSMIDQTIEQTADWNEHIGEFGLAINMSPSCILNPDLPDRITRKFESAGVDPRTITFEVTEDRLMAEQPVILEVLSRLRLAGFNLSLDDFGTGAASIEQIRKFPFHEVKIDRQFILNATYDEFSYLTIEAAVKLSKLRGMTVVAEGIETEESLQLVKQLGVSSAQGFLFSPAIAPDAVLDWVRDHNAAHSVAA